MCTNESLNNEHDIRIKWVRKFGVCRTSYTSFGKFGTPKTNERAPKTRFLVKSVQKKYKLSNTNGPPRFTKLNYTVLWVYYTGCTRKTKKNVPLPKQLQSAWRYYCFPCAQNHASVTRIPSRQADATDLDSRADRTATISKRFLLPNNITFILIIHSGPVARTVPIYKEPRARLIYITIRVNQI